MTAVNVMNFRSMLNAVPQRKGDQREVPGSDQASRKSYVYYITALVFGSPPLQAVYLTIELLNPALEAVELPLVPCEIVTLRCGRHSALHQTAEPLIFALPFLQLPREQLKFLALARQITAQSRDLMYSLFPQPCWFCTVRHGASGKYDLAIVILDLHASTLFCTPDDEDNLPIFIHHLKAIRLKPLCHRLRWSHCQSESGDNDQTY
jgi:hypothetical protein